MPKIDPLAPPASSPLGGVAPSAPATTPLVEPKTTPTTAVAPLAADTLARLGDNQARRVGTPDLVALRAGASTTCPFVDELRPLSRANAAALRLENLKLLADRPDPEAALAAMEREARASQQVLVRRSTRGLEGILKDLRMKTVYEEPGKRDAKYLTYREEVERELGFYDYRPSYGYVSADDLMRGAGTEYGDVILTLKGVEERVTFCQFDSFDQATRANFEQNGFVWEDVAALVVNQRLTRTFEEMPFAYDEAQIFGGVKATDIAEIRLPRGAEYEPLARQTRATLPWVKLVRYDKPTSP